MNFIIQRFLKGHPLYSDVGYVHQGETYFATFGQILDESGNLLHKIMERRDTLIPEGIYNYCFYNSPVNGWVIMLKDVPGFEYIEHHAANWPFQLKGCSAHGLDIDVRTPMLLNSRTALNPWFESIEKASGKILAGPSGTIINGDFGTIKYETLILQA